MYVMTLTVRLSTLIFRSFYGQIGDNFTKKNFFLKVKCFLTSFENEIIWTWSIRMASKCFNVYYTS